MPGPDHRPILAGVRRPGPRRPHTTRTRVNRDCENVSDGVRTRFTTSRSTPRP